MSETIKVPGRKYVFGDGTEILSMIVHRERLYVATSKGVYVKDEDGDGFQPLMIVNSGSSAMVQIP